MFAVIKTGGKQYRVAADDMLQVEKVAGEPGDIIQFGEVLVIGGDAVTLGTPTVAGASVAAEVVEQRRGPQDHRLQEAAPEELAPQARAPPGVHPGPDQRDPDRRGEAHQGAAPEAGAQAQARGSRRGGRRRRGKPGVSLRGADGHAKKAGQRRSNEVIISSQCSTT